MNKPKPETDDVGKETVVDPETAIDLVAKAANQTYGPKEREAIETAGEMINAISTSLQQFSAKLQVIFPALSKAVTDLANQVEPDQRAVSLEHRDQALRFTWGTIDILSRHFSVKTIDIPGQIDPLGAEQVRIEGRLGDYGDNIPVIMKTKLRHILNLNRSAETWYVVYMIYFLELPPIICVESELSLKRQETDPQEIEDTPPASNCAAAATFLYSQMLAHEVCWPDPVG